MISGLTPNNSDLEILSAEPVISGGRVYDGETIGYLFYGGMIVNDMLTIEAGYGGTDSENDLPTMNETDDAVAYYLQAVITLAPGVSITPKIGVLDYKKGYGKILNFGSIDQLKLTYFGAKWQVSF